jgi:hypothetical protein
MPVKITKTKVEVREFVPSCELEKDENDNFITPEAERVVFKYRDLTPAEQLELSDFLYSMSAESGGRVDQVRPAHVALETVLLRLVGWRNITDEDGVVIPFPQGKAALREILNMLPYEVFIELVSNLGIKV